MRVQIQVHSPTLHKSDHMFFFRGQRKKSDATNHREWQSEKENVVGITYLNRNFGSLSHWNATKPKRILYFISPCDECVVCVYLIWSVAVLNSMVRAWMQASNSGEFKWISLVYFLLRHPTIRLRFLPLFPFYYYFIEFFCSHTVYKQ